jgi:outer membrane protein assembly factor BamB
MKLLHHALAFFIFFVFPCLPPAAHAGSETSTTPGDFVLKREWELDIGKGITAPPAAIGTKLLALTTDGWAVMIDCARGSILWRERVGYGFDSAPLVSDTLAFVVSEGAKRYLACLSLHSGKRKWKIDAGSLRAGPLLVPNGLVMLEAGDSLRFFRTSHPSPGWSAPLLGPCLEEMHLAGERVMVACTDSIFTFDARSGALAESAEADDLSSFVPLEDGSGVLLVHEDGGVQLLDRELDRSIWSARVEAAPRHHLGVDGAKAYVSSGGKLSCFETGGGALLWETRLSSPIAGPPCVSQETLALSTVDGVLALLSPDTGEVRATQDLGEPVAIAPVVCAGNLILATQRGRLVSFRAEDAGGSR